MSTPTAPANGRRPTVIDHLQRRVPAEVAAYLHHLLTAILAAVALLALLLRGFRRGPAAAVAAAV